MVVQQLFADAWAANKDGWRKTMDEAAYRRVIAEMKSLAGKFPKEAPAPAPPPADEFGIGDDEIPF